MTGNARFLWPVQKRRAGLAKGKMVSGLVFLFNLAKANADKTTEKWGASVLDEHWGSGTRKVFLM